MTAKLPIRQMRNLGAAGVLFGDSADADTSDNRREIPLTNIRPLANQPRKFFDPDALQSLAQSISTHGILQPLLVRPVEEAFEILAGERRFRAATIAGLETVPCIIREIDDSGALEIALLENLQREDINPYEETQGILRLLESRLDKDRDEVLALLRDMWNLKRARARQEKSDAEGDNGNNVIPIPEEAAVVRLFQQVGRFSWESFLQNRVPMLGLPEEILEALQAGKIAYTKALAISKLSEGPERTVLLERASSEGLSLTDIKAQVALVQQCLAGAPETPSSLELAVKIEKKWSARKDTLLKNPATKRQAQKINSILRSLEKKREELISAYEEILQSPEIDSGG